MADIAIVVTGFGESQAVGSFRVSYSTQESSQGLVASSDVQVSYGANASQINAAIVNSAVLVFADLGITVGGGDKKVLMGGAT